MKKIIYATTGILVLIGIALFVINFYKKPAPVAAPSAPSQIPSLPSAEDLAKQGKIALPTDQGSVAVNDPYKESLKTVAGNADLKNTPNYEIVYLGDLKSFVITIYGPNLNDSRTQAEQAFLDSLGISKDDACKLKVTLAVSREANANIAGKNYGLSFCPNGKPFPVQ